MKITQDVRKYAAEKGLEEGNEVLEEGMAEMSETFKKEGSKLYL